MKRMMAVGVMLAVAAGCVLMERSGVSALRAPEALTAEYLADPVGLDCAAPRLSWKLAAAKADERNLRQGAYQVLVASSPEKLAKGNGNLWNSGRVASPQSLNVVYKGRALKSSQRCYWKVRAWAQGDDAPSAWSAAGSWVMGVVRPEDWKAQWIGANAATRPDFDLAGAKWIWPGDASSVEEAEPGTRYFRKFFDAPENPGGRPVVLAITGDEEYEVWLNGKMAVRTWGHLNAPRWMRFVEVTEHIRPGQNVMTAKAVSQRKGPTGLLAALRFADGTSVVTDDSWNVWVGSERPSDWGRPLSESTAVAWRGLAKVAAAADAGPWGKIERRVETASPAFEKTFAVSKPLKSATLHITGLGFYEASLNGRRVGCKVLDPAPTRYDRRVLYSTYDLTKEVARGQNRLNVLLGHGWYDVRSVAVWNFDNAPWRDFPRMIAQLELLYADGTKEMVCSGPTWRQVPSPLGFDCIREGEVIGMPPPNAPDLARDALMAEVVPAPAGRLAAQAMPPSVVAEEVAPQALREVRPGVWTIDFGQNMAGWIRVQVRGQNAGDVITVRYGERVTADGELEVKDIAAHFRYPASYAVLPGGGFQVDRFVCDGSARQVYEPRFTYNGFQYAQISGLRQAPTAESVVACVVQTDFKPAGAFVCSNDLINQMQEAINWSYRGNFANGYPTDCPHREKNGWTGDAQLAAEMAMYNFQNTAAYEKWVGDLMDEQRDDGNLPGIVPTSGWGYAWGNGPAWDSALVTIPWTLYVYQGDIQILEKAYPAMAKYVDYMTSRAKDGILSHGLSDWIPVDTKTPVEVTSTGYYYLDALIVARTADLLGKRDDAQRYLALADAIRDAYNTALYKGGGVYSIGSQTAQSCALHQGLVPEEARAQAEARLIAAVEANDAYPDFGILGSKYVFRALSDAGRTDLAFEMATKDDKASYGAWLRKGATTFWEDWGEGASRNHVMFGDVSAWWFQYLGGIRLAANASPVAQGAVNPNEVAFKSFVIAPEPVEGLAWVKAEHESPYGTIRSIWTKGSGMFCLEVEVPVNTTATVCLPVEPGTHGVIADAQPILPMNGRMTFKVGSGTYTFIAPLPAVRSGGPQ
ncbi:MAG: glycoside hydrolase family 78 protein [Kiritimatiellaeota bacterium]|nr:glycoside hydrolase family 78 protein [Kiritimatiellota bacterium]